MTIQNQELLFSYQDYLSKDTLYVIVLEMLGSVSLSRGVVPGVAGVAAATPIFLENSKL